MRLEGCIRKGLRLKAHRVREVREADGRLVAEVEWIETRPPRCGRCGPPGKRVAVGQPVREWRDLKVRDQEPVLRYAPRRARCSQRKVRIEQVPWAGRWQRVTKALSLAPARLAKALSWNETAEHYQLDWMTVAAAVKTAVARGLARRKWKPLHLIGIDEVSRSKGQRYLTLVYDLERRPLAWIGENRDARTTRSFFTWLGPRKARPILIVCCDMWAVCREAVRGNLPESFVVFDRYHVVQHLNRAVDEVRRQAWRSLRGEERSAFKRTRRLWLKNPRNLKRQEKRRLSELCRKNSPIVRAYDLKESFRRFWGCKRAGWAAPCLKHRLWWASHCRLEPFVKLARMNHKHLDGILLWRNLRVANGALEGMNKRVRVVSHGAYGYRTVASDFTASWHGCGELPLG